MLAKPGSFPASTIFLVIGQRGDGGVCGWEESEEPPKGNAW